jgi:DNA (cytosine-5)-methyltransferase 1
LNIKSDAVFDQAAVHSETNKLRIDYLFDHDLHELPDHVRPDCHRLKKHSYNSVYGRMRWDEVAPTITTGFGSTGQGRFVHPLRRRTLTPHEAARIQFIPDFFDFGNSQRRQLQEMIGNAVPPKLSFMLALELLR